MTYPDGARVAAVADAPASDDEPEGYLRAGDEGTVVGSDGDLVAVRFDRRPDLTVACDAESLRAVTL